MDVCMLAGLCRDMSREVCRDICVIDMYPTICTGMHIDRNTDVSMDECVDMCIDTYIDMHMDICIHIHKDMSANM